jgi:hypothetical protein
MQQIKLIWRNGTGEENSLSRSGSTLLMLLEKNNKHELINLFFIASLKYDLVYGDEDDEVSKKFTTLLMKTVNVERRRRRANRDKAIGQRESVC